MPSKLLCTETGGGGLVVKHFGAFFLEVVVESVKKVWKIALSNPFLRRKSLNYLSKNEVCAKKREAGKLFLGKRHEKKGHSERSRCVWSTNCFFHEYSIHFRIKS